MILCKERKRSGTDGIRIELKRNREGAQKMCVHKRYHVVSVQLVLRRCTYPIYLQDVNTLHMSSSHNAYQCLSVYTLMKMNGQNLR